MQCSFPFKTAEALCPLQFMSVIITADKRSDSHFVLLSLAGPVPLLTNAPVHQRLKTWGSIRRAGHIYINDEAQRTQSPGPH